MADRSDLILQYFGYLITEYDFSVEEKVFDPGMMGNAFVKLKSSLVGIEIVIDRDQVLITLGDPMEPREKWIEYSAVLQYFAPSEVAYSDPAQLFNEKRANNPSNKETWEDVVETQLRRIASMFRQYCETILNGKLGMKNVIEEIKEKNRIEMLQWLDKFNHTPIG
jgi:hypothetical protein